MLQPKDSNWLNEYKNKTNICAVYKKPTSDLKTHRRKVRGWKNIFHANEKQKNAGVAILISDKIDLKVKTITRDKEGHNIGAPQYTRQTLTDIKGEIDSNTITVGDFNTPLTPMHRSIKQKINKESQVFRFFNVSWCTFFLHGF